MQNERENENKVIRQRKCREGNSGGNIPLLDKMIQRIRRLMLLQILGLGIICLANRPCQLLRKSLLFPECPQNRLMKQKPNILGIIKGSICCRPLVSFFLVPRFAWIDALEYAKATEIGERDLKEFERLIAGYV